MADWPNRSIPSKTETRLRRSLLEKAPRHTSPLTDRSGQEAMAARCSVNIQTTAEITSTVAPACPARCRRAGIAFQMAFHGIRRPWRDALRRVRFFAVGRNPTARRKRSTARGKPRARGEPYGGTTSGTCAGVACRTTAHPRRVRSRVTFHLPGKAQFPI